MPQFRFTDRITHYHFLFYLRSVDFLQENKQRDKTMKRKKAIEYFLKIHPTYSCSLLNFGYIDGSTPFTYLPDFETRPSYTAVESRN